MVQKSIQILVLAAVLVLGAIVAYSMLRLHGPADQLREAERAIADGRLAEAIQLLDLTERSSSVANDAELQTALWRLRYRAYSELDNARGALLDVEHLIQAGAADEPLLLDRIRLLARAGDGASARLAARDFLTSHADHPRALELCGEACQTVYQPVLRELRESVEREVGRRARPDAQRALLAFVYRPDRDPEVQRAAERLRDLFSVDPRMLKAWPALWQSLQELRAQVQEGLDCFQRSLDQGGQPVAAFRAIATALDQAGRHDDLQVACELYRRDFDHDYVDEAGVIAAWALFRDGLHRAAIACCDRWLSPARLDRVRQQRRGSPELEQLALVRVIAAFELGEEPELARAGAVISLLREVGTPCSLALQLMLAGRRILRADPDAKQTALHLRNAAQQIFATAPRHGRPDLAEKFVPLWIEQLIAGNAGEGEVLGALASWSTARPDAAEPLLHQARYQLTRGNTSAAQAAIAEAAQLEPEHPALFPLRLEIARRQYQGTTQDGPGLLSQCVKRGTPVPEDLEDPIGYVLCAEAAAAVPAARRIAIACALRAVDAFPYAAEPRHLELRMRLAADAPLDAARAADRALSGGIADAETVRLALASYRAAGRPLDSLIRSALPLVAPHAEFRLELLRTALRTAPATAATFLPDDLDPAAAEVELLLLAAEARAIDGDAARAARLLDGAAARVPAHLRSTAARAFACWLDAAARDTTDDALASAARSRWQASTAGLPPQAPVLDAIATIATTHPETAHSLLPGALAAAAPDERGGVHHVLAGRLALRARNPQLAADHWTAAMAFADGEVATESLARLAVVRGDLVRAERLRELITNPTDGMLAARFGDFGLAATLLTADLLADRADLLAHAALAAFGQASMTDWQPGDLALQHERLELLSCLRDPDCAALVVPRAEALLQRNPRSRTNKLLLARTLLAADQPERAAALHTELRAGGLDDVVFYREFALATATPGYVPDAVMLQRVMSAGTSGLTTGSPTTTAWAMQAVVQGLRDGGLAELADRTLVAQWLAQPTARRYSAQDLDLAERTLPPRDAAAFFDQVLAGPLANDRRDLAIRMARCGRAALASEPHLAPQVAVSVQRQIEAVGPVGDLVHLLLDVDPELPQPARTALLQRHLLALANGSDDRLVGRTIQRVTEELDPVAAAAMVDTLLDSWPTSTLLWATRAHLTQRTGGTEAPLRDLRNVLAHVTRAEAWLECLTLAARVRQVLPSDRTRFAELPGDLRTSPLGRFADGFLALREGRSRDAIPLLQEAAPQPDGMHLFALAMALLQSEQPDALARAHELFVALRRDHTSHSLARHAGSFARQSER